MVQYVRFSGSGAGLDVRDDSSCDGSGRFASRHELGQSTWNAEPGLQCKHIHPVLCEGVWRCCSRLDMLDKRDMSQRNADRTVQQRARLVQPQKPWQLMMS